MVSLDELAAARRARRCDHDFECVTPDVSAPLGFVVVGVSGLVSLRRAKQSDIFRPAFDTRFRRRGRTTNFLAKFHPLRESAQFRLPSRADSRISPLLRSGLVSGLVELRLARLHCSPVFRQTKNHVEPSQFDLCEDSSVEEQMTDTHPDAGSNPAPALLVSLLS
jgi:hypothetical protein